MCVPMPAKKICPHSLRFIVFTSYKLVERTAKTPTSAAQSSPAENRGTAKTCCGLLRLMTHSILGGEKRMKGTTPGGASCPPRTAPVQSPDRQTLTLTEENQLWANSTPPTTTTTKQPLIWKTPENRLKHKG